jgi:hypothetical protein
MSAQGFYTTITAEQYHADPCETPSLSNSIGIKLIDSDKGGSPLHAWTAHPKLNPNYTDKWARKLDAASGAHHLLLGRGKQIDVLQFDSFRTNAAKEARDASLAVSHLPLLAEDYENAVIMRHEAAKFLHSDKLREEDPELSTRLIDLFNADGGHSEPVVLWEEDDIRCRSMMDRVSADLRLIVDYKTTTNAHPDAASKRIFDNSYQMQDAWYRRGLDAVDPEGRGRRRFVFLYQETEEPWCCSLIELDGHARAIGERQVHAATTLWRRCMRENKWPGYPPGLHYASMKPWDEGAWLAREMAEPWLMDGFDGGDFIEQRRREPMLTDLSGG